MGSRDVEEYISWEKDRNSFWSGFRKSVNPITMLGFVALIVVGIYMVSNSKINPTYVYIAIALVTILIITRSKKPVEKEPIPENVSKIIALASMRRKIGKEFPNGTIVTPLAYCRMRYEGEWGSPFRPWKWEIGFSIVYPTGLKETQLILVHPFEGYLTGIVKKPAGYSGEESHDLKVLLPLQIGVQDEKAKK